MVVVLTAAVENPRVLGLVLAAAKNANRDRVDCMLGFVVQKEVKLCVRENNNKAICDVAGTVAWVPFCEADE
jgi:hypothetical protein